MNTKVTLAADNLKIGSFAALAIVGRDQREKRKLATESTETERLSDREKKREFFHRSLFRIIRYNS